MRWWDHEASEEEVVDARYVGHDGVAHLAYVVAAALDDRPDERLLRREEE